MNKEDAILVTGAAGFIGSYLVGCLNTQGYNNLILVDEFGRTDRQENLKDKHFSKQIDRNDFISWWALNPDAIQYAFHLGARTDTTEMDFEVHKHWNIDYSKAIWQYCTAFQVPLVYASSAATYGNGAYGYSDSHDILDQLKPLNPYGLSKLLFDQWALAQDEQPPFWAGVKFFNVYGPNEFHKGRMASVIFHAYHQIVDKGMMNLFRSHNPDYADGGQMRDFIYVKDIVAICQWLMEAQPECGLYNAGTGQAQTFMHLAKAIFHNVGKEEVIKFIDTPVDIRDKYQYFTEADMDKLKKAGYNNSFSTLQDGIEDYVTNYLSKGTYF